MVCKLFAKALFCWRLALIRPLSSLLFVKSFVSLQPTIKNAKMYFDGIIIAVATFFIIGMFHPIVIKAEYYWGVKCWPLFAVVGVVLLIVSLFIQKPHGSAIVGVIGCSALWSILEIFEQRERVRKGWFPKNPKRKKDYE